ncbi:TIGR01777 family oxidoreductase [Paenibacillus sp. NPDC058071]|uniref:TIGR01777 family oxidoreductase n=1 Tax=Paenibacillus sp. NPDC058071 TaxID=3346326 RepID=UPI0036DE6302
MRVAVTGGTGFVGKALVAALLARGDEVWVISRTGGKSVTAHKRLHTATWTELAENPSKLQGIEAIVNLAGESISKRWTPAAKKRVLDSRLQAAARIARFVEELRQKPVTVINASGISTYGHSLDQTFDESSPTATSDFLSGIVRKWEKAADAIDAERIVKLRFGVVLSGEGGAFPLMALPHRLFAGGRLGSGKQWLSWIHLEDAVRLVLFCLDQPAVRGAVNVSAPEPVTNDEFGRALGKAIGRPHWLPAPAFALKLALGEMSAMLLEGQRALPAKALSHGFEFRYPTIEDALRAIVEQSKSKRGS